MKKNQTQPKTSSKSPRKSFFKAKRRTHGYYSEDDSEYDEEESDDEKEEDSKMREIKRKYKVSKNVWIVKPGENTNRGNGITVCGSLQEIKKVIQQAHANPATRDRSFIIQKYIDHPLLISGRKFDFRCFGLLTSINGYLKGYFYDDGYVRTSCEKYDIDDLTNKFVHLTNDAVQKKAEDYGKFENGNKMSL